MTDTEARVAAIWNQVQQQCLAETVFWPDDEACEAVCSLPEGHQPANIHRDDILGEWDENELPATYHPERESQ